MNRIYLVLFVVVALLTSCEKKIVKDTYNIEGKIKGVEDGKKIYVQKIIPGQRPVSIDTVEVKKERFHIEGKAEEPMLHVLFLEGERNPLAIVFEEGNIDVEFYKDSIPVSKISGTPSNNDLHTYISNSSNLRDKVKALREQQAEASRKDDDVTLNTLNEAYADVIEEGKNYDVDFVKTNVDSYTSVLVLDQMFNSKSKKPEEILELFNGLSETVQNTTTGKSLKQRLASLTRLSVGSVAPDFSGPTPDGNTISLKESLGKITVLDFWAAWCKPCRAENPNLVALYNEYHDKGLNVIGVSLDRKAEDWKKAIEDDKLAWNHVSNLQFWQDPIAKLYNIRSIPATYLLDSEGKIIAKSLRGKALHDKVAELLSM